MLRSTQLTLALLLAFNSTIAHAELVGGVDSGTYGEITYEEIKDIELRAFPSLMAHPYEVLIRNTPARKMILCQLLDKNGKIVAGEMRPTSQGNTWIFFTDKLESVTARCYYASVERKIRP